MWYYSVLKISVPLISGYLYTHSPYKREIKSQEYMLQGSSPARSVSGRNVLVDMMYLLVQDCYFEDLTILGWHFGEECALDLYNTNIWNRYMKTFIDIILNFQIKDM